MLCEITCDDGSVYKIAACIRARLLEINMRLLEEPSLLNTKVGGETGYRLQFRTDGYIALFAPKVADVMNIQKSLLTAQEYIRFFKDRERKGQGA